jgi:hypothetical protein
MRRVAGLAAAIAVFAAVIADGTPNTIMFGAIARAKLAELPMGYAAGPQDTAFFKSAGGLRPETELVSGFTVAHPISSAEEAR